MGCLFVDLRRNVQIKWLLSLARLIHKSFVYKKWANKPRVADSTQSRFYYIFGKLQAVSLFGPFTCCRRNSLQRRLEKN